MNKSKALPTFVIVLTLLGCTPNIKRDVVLEKSADRMPGWAQSQTFEKDQYLYLVGEGTDRESYALAGRIAKASAAQALSEATGLRMKSELTQSVQRLGLQTSGTYVQDTVAMATELVTVQDLLQEESYREKLLLADNDQVRYRVVNLYKLPVAQFKAAKIRALEAMEGRATKLQDYRAMSEAKRLLEETRGK